MSAQNVENKTLGPKPIIKIGDKVILKDVPYRELVDLDREAFELGWYGEAPVAGIFDEIKDFRGKTLTISLVECDGEQFEVEGDDRNWSFSIAWIASIVNAKCLMVPRNNDGREECYWCNVPTQKRGGGIYDVCPRCGK